MHTQNPKTPKPQNPKVLLNLNYLISKMYSNKKRQRPIVQYQRHQVGNVVDSLASESIQTHDT